MTQPLSASTESAVSPEPKLAGTRSDFRSRVFALTLAGLIAPALYQRFQGLIPTGLQLDDVWVAVLVKSATLSFIVREQIPTPPGFVLLLRAVTGAVGFGDGQLQIVPVIAGLGLIPLVGWIAHRLTGGYLLGLTAAAWMAANPWVIGYSLRIKQFTFDALLVAVVFAVAMECLRTPKRANFWALTATAGLIPFFSFSSLFFSTCVIGAVAWRLWRDTDSAAVSRRDLLFGCTFFGFASGAVFLGVMNGRANAALVEYWRDYYLPTDSVRGFFGFLAGTGKEFFILAFPPHQALAAVLVPVGLIFLCRHRQWRPLGIALTGFYGLLFILSALRIYPLGGGRTDIFTIPVSVLAAVAGLWAIGRVVRRLPEAAAVVVVCFFVFEVVTTPYRYLDDGGRRVVKLVTDTAGPSDGLIVYPLTNWALGLYGPWPTRFVKNAGSSGFVLEVENPNALILPYELIPAVESPETSDSQHVLAGCEESIKTFSKYPRIILAAGSVVKNTKAVDWMISRIRAQGYAVRQVERDNFSCLLVFERVPPSPGS